MDKETFDKILLEEGIDDANLRNQIWHSRPPGGLREDNLRAAAKKFVAEFPNLQARQALNKALDREYGRDGDQWA